jgi:hypothetical protein
MTTLLIVALLVFGIRLLYLWRFRYQSPPFRPIGYLRAKLALTIASDALIAAALISLLLKKKPETVLLVLAVCVTCTFLERAHSYRRAVTKAKFSLNPNDKELRDVMKRRYGYEDEMIESILSGKKEQAPKTPAEIDRVAKEWVKSDIRSGTLA